MLDFKRSRIRATSGALNKDELINNIESRTKIVIIMRKIS